MYRKLNIPTLGLIENMSHFACAGCGQEADLFGRGGGEALAKEMTSCRSLGAFRSTHPCARAATPVCRLSSENLTPRPRAPSVAAAERVAQQVSISARTRKAIPLVRYDR